MGVEKLLVLGSGLSAQLNATGDWYLVLPDGEPPIAAIGVNLGAHRCLLGLPFIGGDHVINISYGPDAWAAEIERRSVDLDVNPAQWSAAIVRGLNQLATDHSWWEEPLTGLQSTATAAAWPLLRPSVQAGDTLQSIPRWAAGLLAGPTLSEGVRRELGRRGDRRVIRALGECLGPSVDWWALAIALGLPQLDAGRLGNFLEQNTQSHRCSQAQFATLVNTLGTMSAVRAMRLLKSAEGGDGVQRLLVALETWQRASLQTVRLPSRLPELEAIVVTAMETPATPRVIHVAGPEQAPQRQYEGYPPGWPQPRVERTVPVQPLIAPDISIDVMPGQFRYPIQWQRLHRRSIDDIELVLPAGPDDLELWSRLLSNCLDTYAAAIATGHAVIFGIRIRGMLTGAVDIDPDRRIIRQVLGPKNRRLPTSITSNVMEMLDPHLAVAQSRRSA
jgi:hypothetical protein